MDVIFYRDEICRQDVGRMAELGRFGEEFTFYGCILYTQGKRKYCMSEQAEQIYDYRLQWILEGHIVTPIKVHSKRLMIPSGMREGLKQSVRLEFAKMLRDTFPSNIFAFLARYSGLSANDTAYEELVALQKDWSGAFDADHLNLYSNLVQEAFVRKRLSVQSYLQLRQWTNRLWDQPGLGDAPREQEQRTFSAFLYDDGTGALHLESGLPKYKVLSKKEDYDLKEQRTTPIFTKTCWFKDITQLRNARQAFEVLAQSYLSGSYWEAMQRIRALPSVLADSDFAAEADNFTQGSRAAVQMVKWYQLLWE